MRVQAKQPLPNEWKQLEEQLRGYVDGWLGNAVAALPDEERGTPAFAQLAQSFEGLLVAVLRHRFNDPSWLRLIRRFAAALLPEAGDDALGEGPPSRLFWEDGTRLKS